MSKSGIKTSAAAWQPTTQAASKSIFTSRPFPEIVQREQETAVQGETAAQPVKRRGMIENINRSMSKNFIPEVSNVGIVGVQAKLTIGEPGDQYEQEADRVAAEVVQKMNAPASPGITAPPRMDGIDKTMQRKPVYPIVASRLGPGVDVPLMRQNGLKASPGPNVQADFETKLNRARGGGGALDAAFRAKIEPAMGADFSRVRVHTDSGADEMSQEIQAKAFTTGQDVFFRQGAYEPGSRGGQELIAHELTHVVQQNGGAVMRSALSYKATDSKTVEHVIQRYDMTYGALNNDCGTDMHVLIEGNQDPDLSKGSKPSVLPSWWPASGTTERDYFQQYVVQGHLLNQNLGGPGNTMENLTPITKSTNTTHFKQIEDEVKKEVDQGNWVEYRVQADYTTPPSMSDLGVNVPASVAPYLAYFAGEIGADYTVYDPITGKKKGGLPGVKLIKNEGKHLKGTF